MPIETNVPTSEGWWLKTLLSDLEKRQAKYNLLDDYYRGEAPMPWGPENCQESFRRFQRKARANWAALIVEAVRERMMPVGFRTGAPDDDLGDKEADRIWRANNLPATSQLVHRAKLSMGDAYTIVGQYDPEIGAPLITAEDPRQVITAQDPRDRRRTLAAVKVFSDNVNMADTAYLYLPGRVLIASRRRTSIESVLDFGIGGWEWKVEQRLGHNVVPVVHFPNRADLYGRSMGEFEDVTDDIDRINLMLLQRLTVAVMQAFRQRAVEGDLPATDTDGAVIDYGDLFRADPGALWQLPDGVKMWESAGVDLTPLLESVKADVRDLAATTRTPMFYLTPDAANGSAEGASLQREGLVFKATDRIIETTDPWDRTMSLAFLFSPDEVRYADGADRSKRADIKTLWRPPERFSLAEKSDAALKAKAAGVPWRTRMREIMQYEPAQVEAMEAERATDALWDAPMEPEPDAAVGV